MKDDYIVETTIYRTAYFGATFRGEAGDIIVGIWKAKGRALLPPAKVG